MASRLTPREERAMEQRRANEAARAAGEPLPHPNMWDALDPTKIPLDVEPDAEAYRASYRAFRKICSPPPPRWHTL